MGISTHILDTSRGLPARNVGVSLDTQEGPDWKPIAKGTTDDDGRVKPLIESIPSPGTYRIRFDVGPYFESQGFDCFYEQVSVEFVVKSESEHYHVPLLINPFGYTTYRGT